MLASHHEVDWDDRKREHYSSYNLQLVQQYPFNMKIFKTVHTLLYTLLLLQCHLINREYCEEREQHVYYYQRLFILRTQYEYAVWIISATTFIPSAWEQIIGLGVHATHEMHIHNCKYILNTSVLTLTIKRYCMLLELITPVQWYMSDNCQVFYD